MRPSPVRVSEAIVRDLAAEPAIAGDDISEWCAECGEPRPEAPVANVSVAESTKAGDAINADLTWHAKSCVWRRAAEWVAANGGTDG